MIYVKDYDASKIKRKPTAEEVYKVKAQGKWADELYNYYGYVYKNMSKEERQELWTHYLGENAKHKLLWNQYMGYCY